MRTLLGVSILTAALITFAGCSSSSTTGGNQGGPQSGTPTTSSDVRVPKKKKGHEPGPHGGTVIDWGMWHLEFCVDHPKEEIRVYVLASDEKTPAPIKTDKLLVSIKKPLFQMELKPEKQPGDPAGSYSCFVGKAKEIGVKQDFAGTITGTVDGKQYNEDFAEAEEHGHDHPHKK